MKYWLVAIISILTFISAYISSAVSFADKRFKWYKWIKKNVWIFVVINGSIALLSGFQVYLNDSESDTKDSLNKKEQNSRDLSLRQEYYKTKKSSDSLMSEILAKYGLKFDSASKALVKVVRDSSKTKVILSDSPILAVGGDGISLRDCKEGRCTYNVKFSSRDAGSTSFSLQTSLVAVDSLGYYYRLGDLYLLSENDFIPKDASYIPGFEIDEKLHFEECI